MIRDIIHRSPEKIMTITARRRSGASVIAAEITPRIGPRGNRYVEYAILTNADVFTNEHHRRRAAEAMV